MKKILLCTHGEFAIGIKNSVDVIVGSSENVYTLCVSMEDSIDTVKEKIEKFTNGFEACDEKIIMTDIPGGSTTQASFYFISNEKNVHVVTGLNLGLLLEILLSQEENIQELIRNSISLGKDTMQYLNDAFVF